MKKWLSVLLAAVMLLGSVTALAEDWTCPSCSGTASGNFCSNCGSAKPANGWTCPTCSTAAFGNYCYNCGAARPAEAADKATAAPVTTATPAPTATPTPTATPAPTATPTPTATPAPARVETDEFKAVLNFLLHPATEATVSTYINFGDGRFTVLLTDGSSYSGLLFDDDDTFSIKLYCFDFGKSSSLESPYNYQSDDFKRVLNYLIRKTGATITTVIPLYTSSNIYTLQDSAGKAYRLSVLYTGSMISFTIY